MKHQVHNLFLLDASGSMQSIKQQTIASFNEIVESVQSLSVEFPEQEHIVSLLSFNTSELRTILWRQPVGESPRLTAENFLPNGGTPLFDAMGYAINKLRQDLYGAAPHNVLVTIFTDGQENSSREFTGDAIRRLKQEMEEHNWTFTYVGTGHDVAMAAGGLHISAHNDATYDLPFGGGVDQEYLKKEQAARKRYAQKIRDKQDTRDGFYDEGKK